MDFSIPESSEQLRLEVRRLLSGVPAAELRERMAGCEGEADVRPLYRLLGASRLLAPAWPVELGGRGGGPTSQLVLAEELVRHGVPLPLHTLTIQIVGAFLLAAGTEAQRLRLLPRMAAGELFACVLLTEPDAGSDLTALATTAERREGGWALSGRKRYSVETWLADVGLCAARTDPAASPYQGLGLFLVPMRDPAVDVRPLAGLADERFHEVGLNGVRVGEDALVGGPGDGWALISRMLAGERSGLNYYARGLRWLEAARDHLRAAGPRAGTLEALGRHWARLEASRWLALRVLQGLEEDRADVALSSLAKWHSSESVQQAAWWALETLGLSAAAREGSAGEVLEPALREAPGATLAAGASEVLLDALAGSRLEAFG
jgi:alkylation response protein AidB-like acyl-CoA dehydrogenase